MINTAEFYPVILTESCYHRWILFIEKTRFKSLFQMVHCL